MDELPDDLKLLFNKKYAATQLELKEWCGGNIDSMLIIMTFWGGFIDSTIRLLYEAACSMRDEKTSYQYISDIVHVILAGIKPKDEKDEHH